MTKPDEHKRAIPVVHIEAVKLFYARNNNILVSFYIKKNLHVSGLAK